MVADMRKRQNSCASNVPQHRYRYGWLILIQCRLCRSSSDLQKRHHLHSHSSLFKCMRTCIESHKLNNTKSSLKWTTSLLLQILTGCARVCDYCWRKPYTFHQRLLSALISPYTVHTNLAITFSWIYFYFEIKQTEK